MGNKRLLAEILGTLTLMLMSYISSLLIIQASSTIQILITVSICILIVIGVAFYIRQISEYHINPIITVGRWLERRISTKQAISYITAQCLGITIGVLMITSTPELHEFTNIKNYSETQIFQIFTIEVLLSFIFTIATLGSNDKCIGTGYLAGILIVFTLIFVNIICINKLGIYIKEAINIDLQSFFETQNAWQLILFSIAPIIGIILSTLTWKLAHKQ